MPLFTAAHVRPYLPPGIAAIILSGETETPDFVAIQSSVTEEITRITGIAVPADVDDSPAWIPSPAAALVAEAFLPRLQSPSDALILAIEKSASRARAFLLSMASDLTPETGSFSFSSVGTISTTDGDSEVI